MNNDSTALRSKRGRRDRGSRSRADKATSRHHKTAALLTRVARDLGSLEGMLGVVRSSPELWRIQQALKFVGQARDIFCQIAAVELGAGAAKVIYGSSRR